MAANYLTIGSTFQPFTYDELLKPIRDLETAHQALEDQYAQYNSSAGTVGSYLDEARDSVVYPIYNTYETDLEKAADDLSKNGLSPQARRNLLSLKSRWNSEIVPIANAVQARQDYIKNYQEAYAKDNTLLSSMNPYTVSVDSFLNGNTPSRLDVSGAQIYDRMKAQATAASQRMQYDPTYFKAMSNQYWAIKNRKGFNSKDAQNFINNIMSIPELGSMISSIMESTGAINLPDAERAKALQYAIEGTLSGMIGDVNYDYRENRAFKLNKDDNLFYSLASPLDLGIEPISRKRDYNNYMDRYDTAKNLIETEYNGESHLVPPDIMNLINFVNQDEYEYYSTNLNQYTNKKRDSEGSSYYNYEVGMRDPDIKPLNISKKEAKRRIDEYLAKEEQNYTQYDYLADDRKTAAYLGTAIERDKHEAHKLLFPLTKYATSSEYNNTKDAMAAYIRPGVYEYDVNTGEKKRRKKDLGSLKSSEFDLYMSKFGDIVIAKDGKFYVPINDTQMSKNSQFIQDAYNILDNYSKDDKTVWVGDNKIDVPGIGENDDNTLRYEDPMNHKTQIGVDIWNNHPDKLTPIKSREGTYYLANVRDQYGLPYRMLLTQGGIPLYWSSLEDKASGNMIGGENLQNMIYNNMLTILSMGNTKLGE